MEWLSGREMGRWECGGSTSSTRITDGEGFYE
jgi:hypothetical protein